MSGNASDPDRKQRRSSNGVLDVFDLLLSAGDALAYLLFGMFRGLGLLLGWVLELLG